MAKLFTGGESCCETKSPNRMRGGAGWLSGLGLRRSSSTMPATSSPSPHRRSSAIADDIRNDHNLFFLDDETPPPVASAFPSMSSKSDVGVTNVCIADSSSAINPGLPRRSSQKKMESLQREVDFALEYFHHETENELDDNDGDDYLNRNPEHYSRMETDHRHDDYGSYGDEYDESLPETDATSNSTSVVTNHGNEPMFDANNIDSASHTGIRGLSAQHKTKSILSLPLSLIQSHSALNYLGAEDGTSPKFHDVVAEELSKIRGTNEQKYRGVEFNTSIPLRSAMEPFLAAARLRREEAGQGVFDTLDMVTMPQGPGGSTSRRSSASADLLPIASNYGIPYPALRNESSFLYDVDSFPLGSILANSLGVTDLSRLHIDHPSTEDKGRLLEALQHPERRRVFHRCFDSFVTSQVIPLLHTQALSKGIFYTNRYQLQKVRPQSIVYRYQAFPNISIVRPGDCSSEPHCEMSQGYSVGNICYHIPLTPSFGTNALYTESHPGREDWHPLMAKSPGLGFQFDGSRCLHFNPRNETDLTQVSLNFRIAITRAPDCHDIAYDPDDQLCCSELLKDKFSHDNPGFYDEISVTVGDATPHSPFMSRPVASKGEIMVIG